MESRSFFYRLSFHSTFLVLALVQQGPMVTPKPAHMCANVCIIRVNADAREAGDNLGCCPQVSSTFYCFETGTYPGLALVKWTTQAGQKAQEIYLSPSCWHWDYRHAVWPCLASKSDFWDWTQILKLARQCTDWDMFPASHICLLKSTYLSGVRNFSMDAIFPCRF